MDVAEAPRIVFESHSRCADSHGAEELLREVLARSLAPGHAWVVAMRIDVTTPGVLHGEGEITNDRGVAVGHRVFTGKVGDCKGLASAVGIWASLALDAEVKRARTVATQPGTDAADDMTPGASPEPAAPSGGTPGVDSTAPHSSAAGNGGAESAQGPSPTDWSASAVPAEKAPRHEEGHTLEVGASGFLMTGSGGGLLFGASPFVLVEVARSVFLRPALAVGETVPGQEPKVAWVATRLDGCLRIAGEYTNLRGMQLDLCGGTDVGVVLAGRAVPYLSFGPSLDLRGELGGDLAVILRGLFGFNAIQDSALDTPLLSGRGELALSWRLR